MHFYECVANIDEIVLGFCLLLRSHALLALNTRNLIEVFEDEPSLLFLAVFEHVLLQSYEAEPHAFSDHFCGRFEEGGCLLEVSFAFLEAEFDVGADAIGA